MSGGGVYVAGDTDANGADGLVAKFSAPLASDAAPAWSKTWPTLTVADSFYGIAASGEGVYAAGYSYQRTTDTVGGKEVKGITVKFPLAGPPGGGYDGATWDVQTPAAPGAFTYGGTEWLSALTTVVEASQVYVYAVGSAQQDGINSGRFYLSKLDANGNVLWTRTDGAEMVGNAYSEGRAVTTLGGNIYAAGRNDDDGSVRPYLRKYDPAGNLLWSRETTTLTGIYYGVAAFGGAIYAVGYSTSGANDFLIEKWDEAGSKLWSRTFDRSSAEDILYAVVGAGMRIYAAGSTLGGTAGGRDAIVLEIDPATGDLLASTLHGGALDDIARGIATDGTDLYVTGETQSFGNGNELMLLRLSLPAGGADTTPPSAPIAVTATAASSSQINLSWTASTDNVEVTLYQIFRGGVLRSTVTAPTTSFSDTGLTASTSYSYTVAACDAAGNCSAQSAAASATTFAAVIQAPGAPTIGTATAGNAQATVSFTAPSNNGGSAITGYTVTSSPGGVTASGSASPITVTGLTNGTTYTFTVTATNSAGTGAASAASNAVTPATVPGAPTGIGAVAGDGQATVTFTPPASNGGAPITSYIVTSTPGSFVATGTGSPITITGLINGVSYSFTVAAVNSAGTGPASGASNSVTPTPATTTTTTTTSTTTSTASTTTTTTPSTTTTSSTTTTTSATTTTTLPVINLTPGWNLVGNGVEASIDVASAFGDASKVATVWKWVISGSTPGVSYPAWAFYTPSLADGGRSHAADKGYDFLTTINAGEGFWVNAKVAFSASLGSSVFVQSSSFIPATGAHALRLGWNLIATGDSPTPGSFNTSLSVTPPVAGTIPDNLTTLWAWDAIRAGWYFWAPKLVSNGQLSSYIANKGYLDFASMPTTPPGTLSPTTGFWVNVP